MPLQRKQVIPYYAYCVLRLEADEPWDVFPGVGERPVFAVREGRIAMAVSRMEPGVAANAQAIVQHGRVVHRVFERHTVLPFRFGTVFDDEQQVRRVLQVNRTEFQDSINRLRGKLEMHVKLLFTNPGPARREGSSDNRDQEFVGQGTRLLAGLLQPLDERVSVRVLRNGECMVHFAHLIEDGRMGAYLQSYRGAAGRISECQVLVTGPWPPYHFLPSTIRVPAASEQYIQPGRRALRRGPASQPAEPFKAHAAKA